MTWNRGYRVKSYIRSSLWDYPACRRRARAGGYDAGARIRRPVRSDGARPWRHWASENAAPTQPWSFVKKQATAPGFTDLSDWKRQISLFG